MVAIAGATGSAGSAAAAAFGQAGARLGLIGTDAGRLAGLASDLGLADGAWAPGQGDLRTSAGADAAVGAIAERLGPVDVLIHVVGGWNGGTPTVAVEADDFEEMLGQHLYSTLHMVQATVPGMVERKWGRVMAISTPLASEPGPRGGGYVAAKAAQEALLRTLARDLTGTGVTANLILVRTIDTKHEREEEPTSKNASWTTPEEIAKVMLFLASDEAHTINGARIPLYAH
ncbi:MAG TPA: SDR family oxidoreductase [Candidatus Limnocylindria bacterium]|nr:SDR family oxidoreductase [Candidatus Limnocylindria bacterium]